MKIRGIQASNFLSWENVVLTNVTDREFWVGPNGGGKSNLVTIVSHVVDMINAIYHPPQYISLPDRQDLAYQNKRETSIDAAIYVEWDAPVERQMLRTALGAMAADPQEILYILNLHQPGQPSLDRLNEYAFHLASHCDVSRWWHGWLGVRWFPWPANDFLVYYAPCTSPTDLPTKYWSIGPNGVNHALEDLPQQPSTSWSAGESITRVYHDKLSDKVKEQVKTFLTIDDLPQVLSDDFPMLTLDLTDSGAVGKFPIVSVQLQGGNQWNKAYVEAMRALGGSININQQEGLDLVKLFQALLQHSILLLTAWRSMPQRTYPYDKIFSAASLDNGKHLALWLFQLKNGTREERLWFQHIQKTVRSLVPGRELQLEVQAHEVIPRNPMGIESSTNRLIDLTVVVEGDIDRPVADEGNGIVEALLLSIGLTAPESWIVLWDEPGAHMHPMTQARIRRALIDTRKNGQIIVVTHSPSFLPSEALKTGGIRRISRLSAGPSQVFSLNNYTRASSKGERKEQEDMVQLLDVLNPALRQVPFAAGVVFVEGHTDFAALSVWYQKTYGWSFEDDQIAVVELGGKDALGLHLRYTSTLGLPYGILLDGNAFPDTLTQQFSKAQINYCAPEESLDDECVVEQLQKQHIFFIGALRTGKLETEPSIQHALTKYTNYYRDKKKQEISLRGARDLALRIDAPEVVKSLFCSIRNQIEMHGNCVSAGK